MTSPHRHSDTDGNQHRPSRNRRVKTAVGGSLSLAALAMVFKLVKSVQIRWRAVNAPHLVALVRAGAHFERGQLAERPEAVAA
jgi:hypothetical protein